MLVLVKTVFIYLLLGFSLTKFNAVHGLTRSDEPEVAGPNVCKRIEE